MKTQLQTISLGIIFTLFSASEAWAGAMLPSSRSHVRQGKDTGKIDQPTYGRDIKGKAGAALNTTGANLTDQVSKALK